MTLPYIDSNDGFLNHAYSLSEERSPNRFSVSAMVLYTWELGDEPMTCSVLGTEDTVTGMVNAIVAVPFSLSNVC